MQSHRATLSEATRQAFEETAYMVVSSIVEPHQAQAPVDIAVSVDISGEVTGRMVLGISSFLLGTLAGNMLGDEVPLPLDQQRDALGEMANIICGAILPAISISGTTFLLSSPTPADLDAERAKAEEQNGLCLTFGVEAGRLEVLFWLG